MTVGELIVAQRKLLGINQAELAKRLGVSASMVSQWEKGLRNPKPETLYKILLSTGLPEIEVMILTFSAYSGVDYEKASHYLNSFAQKVSYLIRTVGGADFIDAFFALNDEGKKIAVDRIKELAEIPKYKADTNENNQAEK